MKKLKTLLLICVFCLTPCLAVSSLADAIIDWYQNDQWSVDYDIEVTDPDGYVNIRSGPGTNYDILTTAPTGTVLHVSTEGLASDGATWCQISYNGYTGWLALSRAAIVESTPTPAPTEAPTPTPEPEATAAPEAAATPEPAAAEAPAAAEDDSAAAKTEAQKDIVVQTAAPAAETAQASSSNRTTLLLVIFILLVVLVIAFAVVLIVLLRKTR